MSEGVYLVFAAILVIALFVFIVSYREDHPKKKKT